MRIEVVVEVPAGSRNKYEVDHATGAIWLDRQRTETIGWADRDAAEREIAESRDRYGAGE